MPAQRSSVPSKFPGRRKQSRWSSSDTFRSLLRSVEPTILLRGIKTDVAVHHIAFDCFAIPIGRIAEARAAAQRHLDHLVAADEGHKFPVAAIAHQIAFAIQNGASSMAALESAKKSGQTQGDAFRIGRHYGRKTVVIKLT